VPRIGTPFRQPRLAATLAQLSCNARLKAEHVFSAENQVRKLRRFYHAQVFGLSTSNV